MICKLKSDDKDLIIINVYISPHPGEKVDHMHRLVSVIDFIMRKYHNPSIIIGGDFNTDLRDQNHELKSQINNLEQQFKFKIIFDDDLNAYTRFQLTYKFHLTLISQCKNLT